MSRWFSKQLLGETEQLHREWTGGTITRERLGEHPAAREFVRRYIQHLFLPRYGQFIRNQSLVEAEDLYALGVVAFVDGIHTFDPERGSTLFNWLTFCLRGTFFKEVRRNYRTARNHTQNRDQPNTSVELVPLDEHHHVEDVEMTEMLSLILLNRAVMDAVQQLGTPYRDIVVRYYMDGWSDEKIGEQLFDPPIHRSTAKRKRDQALQLLKDRLRALGTEER